jgi:hypothetical protein
MLARFVSPLGTRREFVAETVVIATAIAGVREVIASNFATAGAANVSDLGELPINVRHVTQNSAEFFVGMRDLFDVFHVADRFIPARERDNDAIKFVDHLQHSLFSFDMDNRLSIQGRNAARCSRPDLHKRLVNGVGSVAENGI